jgi:hypothetical protein
LNPLEFYCECVIGSFDVELDSFQYYLKSRNLEDEDKINNVYVCVRRYDGFTKKTKNGWEWELITLKKFLLYYLKDWSPHMIYPYHIPFNK